MFSRTFTALALVAALVLPFGLAAAPAFAADAPYMLAKKSSDEKKKKTSDDEDESEGKSKKPSASTKILFNTKSDVIHMKECSQISKAKNLKSMTYGNAIKKGGKMCKACKKAMAKK